MKRILAAVLTSALLLGLVACSAGKQTEDKKVDPSSGTSAQQAEQEDKDKSQAQKEQPSFAPAKVRVAYMPNLGSAGSLFTAQEQGYFQQVGLEVEVKEFQGGPAEIAAMGSGDIDIAQIGHGAHALCIEGKALIFQNDSTNSLADEVVANKSKGISKPEDLKGKTVAVASGTSSEIILQQVLAKAGLSLDDIKTVEMNNEGMTTAMLGGTVDACAAWSPNTVTLKEKMGDNYLSLGGNADFSDKAVFPGSFITTENYAKEHQDILVRFAAAINRAHDYRLAHIEDVAKLLAQKLDVPEATMLGAKNEGDWKTITEVAGDMDALKKIYKTQQEVFINAGRIKQEVPVDQYVRFDIMEQGFKLYEQLK